jgi:hypothetical protein
MLDQPLMGKHMAALAVKVSLAFDKGPTRDDKRSWVLPVHELNESLTETLEVSDNYFKSLCRKAHL